MGLFDVMLNRLRAQDPAKYKTFMAIKNSGRDASSVMSEMYSRGEINDSQLNQISNMLARMGKPVPKSELDKIRNAPRQSAPQSKFKGLF